jgi:hypothetical protein
MNRLTALAIFLALAVPSTAVAAPLEELPFTAACLSATGSCPS